MLARFEDIHLFSLRQVYCIPLEREGNLSGKTLLLTVANHTKKSLNSSLYPKDCLNN